jgi:hypothetical protein
VHFIHEEFSVQPIPSSPQFEFETIMISLLLVRRNTTLKIWLELNVSVGSVSAVMEMAMEAKFRLFIPKRRHGMSGITNSMKAIWPRLFHRRTPALDVKLFIRK